MKYEVLSRRNCVQYSYQGHEETSVVISISDSCEISAPILVAPSKKMNNIKAQLSLFFDDIQPYRGMKYWKKDEGIIVENYQDSEGFTYESRMYQLMRKQDAIDIINFVRKWYDKVDKIIVHCNAGISRSSGVCAGIMKCFEGDDSQIFDNPYFHPNTLCYNLILNEFFEEGGKNNDS